MTRVFLSHAPSDQAFATRLAAALPARGIESWSGRGESGGADDDARWSATAQQALEEADALILVLSPDAMASADVEAEWQFAIDAHKPVLPVLLEPTKVHFQLNRLQYVDFHAQAFAEALTEIADAVHRAVEVAGTVSTGPGAEVETRLADRETASRAIGPPSGTVTFLFIDIQDSARRWELDPEAMKATLPRLDEMLRAAVAEAGGFLYKTAGDAFRMVFARAGDALAAAVAAQRAITRADWPAFDEELPPLSLRAAMHTGEAILRDGDYFGPSVNRVARLEAAGHGGQILLTEGTQLLVREHLPEGCRLRDWGDHRLEDLRFSEHIFQIEGPGIPDVATMPATAGALHPRERVRVAAPATREGGPERDPAEAPDDPWHRLEAAVTGDADDPVTLAPNEARELARHKAADLREWRLGRIAEWSQPRYRLDGRFVGLTLLIDQGEEALQGRWQAKEERFEDLAELLVETGSPVVVVLGPPGSGKSTLLRRLELDTAIASLRSTSAEAASRVTLYVSLNTYRPMDAGEPTPAPGDWLAELWAERAPDLPPLGDLLAEGRVTLLLDGLNEMPVAGEAEFHAAVKRWKAWLQRLVADRPGNLVVLSCRSLDYSQPLSTPELRVPQVRVEGLSDTQVRDFLRLYSPARWREIWAALEGLPQLEVLRSPYFLALLVEQVEATGEMPAGRAALFTGFVRQALRREVERGSALFEPGELLASRDLRQIVRWRWKDAYDLPQRGLLLPKLAALAHAMQDARTVGERAQVRVDVEDALDLLDTDADEHIVSAGAALAILDEDEAAGELMYIHQLVQEYFAARALALEPEPERVRRPWRSAALHPTVDEMLDGLDPADSLPRLPRTGWEETTLLAAAMAPDPAAFVHELKEHNLPLAAHAAALPELRDSMPDELLVALRSALAERSRDPEADLRTRIECGHALGGLGDPRYEHREGPHGDYLLPPLIEIPGGVYPIGGDEPVTWSVAGLSGTNVAHIPGHELTLPGFAIGRFPVTNAEWARFQAAGGYEDDQWWPTPDARRWRRGELPHEGGKHNNRGWRRQFLAEPEMLERMIEEGRMGSEEVVARWRAWMALDDEGFEAALDLRWRPQRVHEPSAWRDERFNRPTQPIVGVCWYEALAYCTWMSAQTGRRVRLPAEVEWEAVAGGAEARTFPWGAGEERWRANTTDMQLKRTSPVGVFVEGDTPLGVADLGGQVYEWTSSLYGDIDEDAADASVFAYPYDATDGREDLAAAPSVQRVVRGGGWISVRLDAGCAIRGRTTPGARDNFNGFRLVVELDADAEDER